MARQDLKGTAVAPGVGIGIARVVVEAGAQKVPRRTLPAEHVAAALLDFEAARERAMAGLRHIQSLTAREFGIQDAAIYGAQIAVLQDPDALGRIRKMVGDDSLEPASAIQALVDRFESTFRALEGGEVKNWAADLRDPWFAVLRELGEIGSLPSDSPAGEPLVLVADELTPSLVTRYPRGLVAGIVAARGGRFSHGAVLARTFSIPTVIGVDGVHARARHGEACVVYGDEGRVLLGADAGQQEDARVFAKERAEVREVFLARGLEACSTSCGESVGVYVNIESPRDLETFDTGMADGVGLFRTEFAYMERPNFPSGKEQTRIYESVLAGFVGKPVVFRTLDIGGDKPLRYFQTPRENNPALGWRGLRVSLEWKDLFLLQLKALAEARAAGDVRVLLPMVTTLDELREARALVDQVHRDSDGRLPKLPLGVMIEVPAAAMALRDLAREADFVSVGSNDLTQYLFAVDRDNPWVSRLYQPYHPALLRVLRYIAQTCNLLGKPLSICGEIAGQAAGALFLVGAGFRQLSVAPPFLAETKAVLRETRVADLRELAARAAACRTAEEAQGILEVAASAAWKRAVGRASGATA